MCADYINNVAAQDAYAAELTLGPDFGAKTVVITVANNAALMQFAVGRPGAWRWMDEREFLSIPQSFAVNRVIGVRFRNANVGQVARILATLSGDDDLEFGVGLQFTGTLSASGGVTGAVLALPVVTSLPVAPVDGQAVAFAVTANQDFWFLQYSTAAGRWLFLGGPPLTAEVATDETTASAAYVDLATVGPSVVIPANLGTGGRFDVDLGFDDESGSVSIGGRMSYSGAGIVAADAISVFTLRGASGGMNLAHRRLLPGQILAWAAGGATIKAQYKATAGTAHFGRRGLALFPHYIIP